MDVREMASLGGKAAAKKLGHRKRIARASKAGKAAAAKITTKERQRRANLAWETRRKNAEQKKVYAKSP